VKTTGDKNVETEFRRKRGRIATATAFAAALGISSAPEARAQEQAQSQPRPHAQPYKGGETNTGRFYAFGGFAAFAPDKNGQLQGERGSPVNLIVGGGYQALPNLALEVNYLLGLRTLDTPPTAQPPAGTFQAGSLDSAIGTHGIGATVKYNFTAGRFAPYFGGGLGFYSTRFLTTSETPGCVNNCSDTGPRVSARSNDLGVHALAGADYHFTAKDVLAGEIRYLKLRADFGAIVPGKVDAGGIFLWMGYRRYF